MTYLLQDSRQYLLDWWTDVDRYAIPGTTVDSMERNPTWSSYATVTPNNTWAGGVSDGLIGAAAMKLPEKAANKSSFVLGTKSYFISIVRFRTVVNRKILCKSCFSMVR